MPGQLIHVEIARSAASPVQGHRPCQTCVVGVFNERLYGSETRAAGNENDRLVAVLSQNVALLHFFKHMGAKQTTREMAYV
jgi:hypothetical protein